jgi:hypothetical protein
MVGKKGITCGKLVLSYHQLRSNWTVQFLVISEDEFHIRTDTSIYYDQSVSNGRQHVRGASSRQGNRRSEGEIQGRASTCLCTDSVSQLITTNIPQNFSAFRSTFCCLPACSLGM